jgi:hypothetical protein
MNINNPNLPEYNRFVMVNQMILSISNLTCLDVDYAEMIADLRNATWNSSASEGGTFRQ